MTTQANIEDRTDYPYVSTGHSPPAEEVVRLVNEAHERYKSNANGRATSCTVSGTTVGHGSVRVETGGVSPISGNRTIV